MYDSPLNRIRIASPCRSDWNQMYGDDRHRFCGECKRNVFNLSGMTRAEAETLLMNSEGPLCVRFYRRKDGTIITGDCPVGWKAMKRRASRMSIALCSLITGFFAGLLSLRGVESAISYLPMGDVPPLALELEQEKIFSAPITGELVDYEEWEGKVDISDMDDLRPVALGQVVRVGRLEKRKLTE